MSEERDRQLAGDAEAGASVEAEAAKTDDEHRLERLTWFGLVGVLVVTGILPDWMTLHRGVAPLVAALVLFVSGVFRFRRGWRVSISIWAAGIALLLLAGFNFLSRPDLDLSLAVIVIAVFMIAAGVFTREN